MLRVLRNWFGVRTGMPDYLHEVLNAGWVPQLQTQESDTAASVLDSVAPAVSTVPEGEVGDWIERFYANQGC